MANVYDFRPGRSLKNVNPQAVGQEMERIRADRGKITPKIVLEEASSPDSPLHAGFEWDDSSAAHQHRLTQARRLIVSVRVLNSPAAKPMTAFDSVRTPGEGRSYVPAAEALSDDELRARFLAEARQMVESLERRYAFFAGVGDLLSRMRQATA